MRKTIVFCVCLSISHFAAFAQLPAGSIAQYPLDNSATDISGNGYNGTLVSTAAAANRFGTAGLATAFVAGTSTGTLPSGLVTALANDFTIAYWFRTTMSAPSSTQWYGGAALVDAEVCGGTSDWGTALINGGEVAMGIGNPDITITSPLSYNDGAWHFVTATRAAAAGIITLYIDGSQVATTSGTSTAARVAPPFIGLGRNPCVATAVFTGSLDDAIAYNSVLTPAQVSNMYTYFSSITLPLQWKSFTGQVQAGLVYLQWTTENSVGAPHFEIERSTDGTTFAKIGETFTTQFIDRNPARGNNFYRIRAVDVDGASSWTSILELSLVNAGTGIHLQSNPVTDELVLINNSQLPVQRLQVLEVSGRVLIDQAPNSGNTQLGLNVSALKAGFYFLRIGQSENTTTIAFVKL